ncbi:hypothetical protein ACR30L_19265 [Psychromonas sp. PT13]|uniref:hypothetical protein n=1 Tax=Psychromonas sp. PT13 TaxID=3439547 RepID=UPI003EB77838
MNKIITTCLMLTSLNALASTLESKSIKLVKKYSSTIACSINKDSYKAEGITDNYDEYVIVYWEGDIGCSGGNGSINGEFTVVSKTHWGDLMVLPKIQQPETKLVCVDTMVNKNELLNVNGIGYGPNDHQRTPNTRFQYTLKLDNLNNKFEVVKQVDNPNIKIDNECTSRVR